MTTALTLELANYINTIAPPEVAAKLTALAEHVSKREAELAKLRDSECDKIMAMTEEQITALTRMQGSNPDDVAKIGKMACDLALKDFAIRQLEAELAACRKDAARYLLLRDIGATFYIGDTRHHVCEAAMDAAADAALAAQEKA